MSEPSPTSPAGAPGPSDEWPGLPLFPLGTVLFPGGLLPLRIFEVRYLDMIRRCQREGRPFGVVTLTQGHEVRQAGTGPEAFHPVGTLATVAEISSPQPGLLMIQAHGGSRFQLQSSQQLKHGLWVGQTQPLADDPAVPVPEDLQGHAKSLAHLLETLSAHAADARSRMPVRSPWHLDDCAWVANRWSELLPLPLETKQQLMALDNPVLRLELVGDLLSPAPSGLR
jgi:Lon protease-like protein